MSDGGPLEYKIRPYLPFTRELISRHSIDDEIVIYVSRSVCLLRGLYPKFSHIREKILPMKVCLTIVILTYRPTHPTPNNSLFPSALVYVSTTPSFSF